MKTKQPVQKHPEQNVQSGLFAGFSYTPPKKRQKTGNDAQPTAASTISTASHLLPNGFQQLGCSADLSVAPQRSTASGSQCSTATGMQHLVGQPIPMRISTHAVPNGAQSVVQGQTQTLSSSAAEGLQQPGNVSAQWQQHWQGALHQEQQLQLQRSVGLHHMATGGSSAYPSNSLPCAAAPNHHNQQQPQTSSWTGTALPPCTTVGAVHSQQPSGCLAKQQAQQQQPQQPQQQQPQQQYYYSSNAPQHNDPPYQQDKQRQPCMQQQQLQQPQTMQQQQAMQQHQQLNVRDYIPKCPYESCPGVFTPCGAQLIWIQRGNNQGFFGCSLYPKCEFRSVSTTTAPDYNAICHNSISDPAVDCWPACHELLRLHGS